MFVELLKESTIKWNAWKWILPGSSGLFALLLLGKNFFAIGTMCSIILGALLIFIIWFVRFSYLCLKALMKYIHNVYVDSIWGYAIVELKDTYSEVHFLRRKADVNDEEYINVMIILCDTLKRIFDKKTHADCCVSIKVPISSDENLESLELRNLCRDSSHRNRDTDQYKRIKHRIIGNTAYSRIVNKLLKGNQKHIAYVNNNLTNSSDYENTSKECYPNGILPYNSELVYPIVPIKGNKENSRDLKGFICIDCKESNKFDETRYDIPMVQGIADGIYDIIAKINNR